MAQRKRKHRHVRSSMLITRGLGREIAYKLAKCGRRGVAREQYRASSNSFQNYTVSNQSSTNLFLVMSQANIQKTG